MTKFQLRHRLKSHTKVFETLHHYGGGLRRPTAAEREFWNAFQLAAGLLAECRPFVQECCPDLGDHVCGGPNAQCDGLCVDAAAIGDLLRRMDEIINAAGSAGQVSREKSRAS